MEKENITEQEKTEKKTEEPSVQSYHTFMFPFLYEMNKTTRKKFEKCLHPGWFLDIWNPQAMSSAEAYNQYHYFNKAAHNAIYTFKDSYEEVVRNFRFDLLSLTEEHPVANRERELNRDKGKNNFIKYIIHKDHYDPQKVKHYSLNIHAIRLRLYNTGVGILVFELENWDHSTEEEITAINDFGRRIYAPFYGAGNGNIFCNICANEIYFELNHNPYNRENAKLVSEQLSSAADVTFLAEPIMKLLSNDIYTVTTKDHPERNEFCIEPIIDDRMFVACYYKNADFVDTMREWNGENYRYITDAKSMYPFFNGKGPYPDECEKKTDESQQVSEQKDPNEESKENSDENPKDSKQKNPNEESKENSDETPKDSKQKNPNAANRLYTMMYVDGDGICCHSRSMLQNLLSDDHIYTRWLENGWYEDEKKKNIFGGSITGFSEYTMISVSKDPPPHLISAFLTEYVEMATLVLAQRASLLSFEYMISECALKRNYKVEDIQEKYTLFQSQILLKEVSPQQQGIELYDMLEKNLMIEKEQSEIKIQIEGLFAQTNFDHDSSENGILFWLSILGIFETADTFFGFFDMSDCIAHSLTIVLTVCVAGGIHWFLKKRTK
ncbi:MAG: hypothetical protein E7603_09780 [Ruminococcaceae bacterium]|nr:hypothetical protein [Oscillospiraceae bacterium]